MEPLLREEDQAAKTAAAASNNTAVGRVSRRHILTRPTRAAGNTRRYETIDAAQYLVECNVYDGPASTIVEGLSNNSSQWRLPS